ncbi:MAG: hypothetical protein AVO34_12385 [Firmicutes bacterium ML8_F2]|jgi:hypothetical protein|nr:MAG: hypothetical protein AVO34_12385 [Firmicutes bacterium ML8_F2]
MKRDMILVIKILEYFENRDEVSVIKELRIPGYDDRVVAYHVRRMYEGGLLDAETLNSTTTETRLIIVWPFGLTWQGHEFLDAIRSKGVTEKLKKRLGETLSQVPFILIKELAIAFGRQQIGLL